VTPDQYQIAVQRLPAGERKVIVRGGSDARYISSGHIIYASGSEERAVPFDLAALQVRAGPKPVIDGVMRSLIAINPVTQLSVAANGTLIYIAGNGLTERRALALADKAGKMQVLPLPPAPYLEPRFSPDGKHLAVETQESNEQIISIFDLSGGASMRRLTIGGRNSSPTWSRDSKYVIFSSDRGNESGLFRQLADGRGSPERLTTAASGGLQVPESIDPSGKVLAFADSQDGGTSIWMRQLEGDAKPTRFSQQTNANAVEVQSAFSADGRFVAYLSTELGTPHVFVRAYPGTTGAKYQITMEAAGFPVWSPDGKQLFYETDAADPKLNSVDVRTNPTFSFANPTVLPFSGTLHPVPGNRNYDISPDGKHFVFVVPVDAQSGTKPSRPQINVVLNWVEELKRRVPEQ
jgi:Tol biopolymer transport system component